MAYIGNSLAQGLVSGANIQDDTVGTADLKDGAVVASKLGDTAIVDKLGFAPQSAAQVAAAVAALVNSAPSALDTLKELSDALGADANFATTITNALTGKVNKSGDTMTGTLNVPRLNLNGAPDGEIVENNGRFSSRHVSFPSYLFKDSSGATFAEVYYGLSGKDLTLINYNSGGTTRIVNNSFENLRADSAGRVTTPNQPAFYAKTFTTGNHSGGQLIAFSETVINRGNCFNGSTSRFNAPVSGVYAFSIGMYVYNNSGTTLQSFAIRVNGSQLALSGDNTIFYSGAAASGDNMTLGTIMLNLAAGDYVTLTLRDGAPTLNCYSGHSYFCGHLIG